MQWKHTFNNDTTKIARLTKYQSVIVFQLRPINNNGEGKNCSPNEGGEVKFLCGRGAELIPLITTIMCALLECHSISISNDVYRLCRDCLSRRYR